MKCLLINDPDSMKSAASLNLQVGTALDPRPMYGTAHFVEHMLFMGNEKYPGESEFAEFMQKVGGRKNGYTTLTNTNFHFDCAGPAFSEALDRFAQFFISPSFTESGTSREVMAINSEFK